MQIYMWTCFSETNTLTKLYVINDSMHKVIDIICPIFFHSFRQSFRNRLRNVGCPFDIIDRLGGWITSGIGQTYGKGYDLNVLSKWMLKVDSNILNKIE